MSDPPIAATTIGSSNTAPATRTTSGTATNGRLMSVQVPLLARVPGGALVRFQGAAFMLQTTTTMPESGSLTLQVPSPLGGSGGQGRLATQLEARLQAVNNLPLSRPEVVRLEPAQPPATLLSRGTVAVQATILDENAGVPKNTVGLILSVARHPEAPAKPDPSQASPSASTGTVKGTETSGRVLLDLAGTTFRIETRPLYLPQGARVEVRPAATSNAPTVAQEPLPADRSGQAAAGGTATSSAADEPSRVPLDDKAGQRLMEQVEKVVTTREGPVQANQAKESAPSQAAEPRGTPTHISDARPTVLALIGDDDRNAPLLFDIVEEYDRHAPDDEHPCRVIFSFDLSRSGRIDLELRHHRQRLALTIRSHLPLPPDIRSTIADLFGAAIDIGATSGHLIFARSGRVETSADLRSSAGHGVEV